jgi:phosphatidylglycerophosphate synthase
VPSDLEAAEEWLLHSLIKDTEGFMSRHFERRVSLALTRWLAWTSLTPNAMTVVSLSIGVTGALFFLSSAPGWQLTGALLFLTHSILDGCDGELARLKFMQSRLGAILDFWGDNLVHVAVFGCIAVGWSLASGSLWPLLLGLIGDVAILASASLMFRRIAADNVKTPGGDVADFLAGALANRDFIYLVIVLAAFGKAKWLLILLVIGAPAFLALVLWRDYLRRS